MWGWAKAMTAMFTIMLPLVSFFGIVSVEKWHQSSILYIQAETLMFQSKTVKINQTLNILTSMSIAWYITQMLRFTYNSFEGQHITDSLMLLRRSAVYSTKCLFAAVCLQHNKPWLFRVFSLTLLSCLVLSSVQMTASLCMYQILSKLKPCLLSDDCSSILLNLLILSPLTT